MIENNQSQDFQNANANAGGNEEGSGIDVRVLWEIFLGYKYWFCASVLACLVAAFVYLRYATPIYQVTAKVLIKDKENRRYLQNSIGNTFSEMGLMNNSNGFDNELEIIGSKTLNRRAVKDQKSYVSYFTEGKVKSIEI